MRSWQELENSEVLLRTFSEPLDGLILMTHLGEAPFRYALSKVPHIGGPEANIPMRFCRRFHAYMLAMTDRKLPIRNECILDCGWNDTQCSRLLQELGPEKMPQAFFVSSDLMALVTLRTLSEMDISVPDRVAVIGLTNLEMTRYSNPPLTTLEIPTEAMGAYAARMLLQHLDGENDMPRRILFPAKLIVRDSA